MDGLVATRMIRSLEAEHKAEDEERQRLNSGNDDQASKGQSTAEGEGASSCVFKPTRNPNRIPIVGLSADIQHATKEKCIKAGMDEYMTKPLLTQGLAILIQRYCCE
ncbi:hypothetical protein BGZ96_009020 [Linnemannia gamsii]|uniref:Response regulatory domain-containing protein n=1 Tax=Linnemannia gamsii TaxID=64522 RepID=A0ABQ7JXY9_9FUNG|nr:hypothetical protein BGZ96_009020 [Linnemannia gamsii]